MPKYSRQHFNWLASHRVNQYYTLRDERLLGQENQWVEIPEEILSAEVYPNVELELNSETEFEEFESEIDYFSDGEQGLGLNSSDDEDIFQNIQDKTIDISLRNWAVK